ncbi:hypothetical protein QYB59_001400 [Clostridium perfringens]|nr:hypothetical protein [Clostridium perfringens]
MRLNKEFFYGMNLRTIIIVVILLIPFIWGTNLAAIWFSDMGTREVSIINRMGISFLVLGPYWVIFIIGAFKNLKRRLINYKLFNIMFFVIYCYYFFLIDRIVDNLMLQI